MPRKPKPSRDDLVAFLSRGLEMMVRDDIKEELADKEKTQKPGARLIELQRAEWEPLGYDADVGCEALNNVDGDYSEDAELKEMRDQYIVQAMRSYLAALEDRRPADLERSRPMPKAVIFEFMDACNTKMDMPEFKEQLLSHVQEHMSPPNAIIVEAQRDLLEVLGWERDHGCECLTNAAKGADKAMQQKFQQWQWKATQTCQAAVQSAAIAASKALTSALGEDVRAEALGTLQSMKADECEALLKQWAAKIKIIMRLKDDAREAYVKKMSREDRVQLAMAQQLGAKAVQEGMAQAAAQKESAGYPTAKPVQQQMM